MTIQKLLTIIISFTLYTSASASGTSAWFYDPMLEYDITNHTGHAFDVIFFYDFQQPAGAARKIAAHAPGEFVARKTFALNTSQQNGNMIATLNGQPVCVIDVKAKLKAVSTEFRASPWAIDTISYSNSNSKNCMVTFTYHDIYARVTLTFIGPN